MRQYTLSVMGGNTPSYYDPLEFKTDSLDEAIQIVELMLKNGHKVTVLSEDTEKNEPSDEFVSAVAEKVAAQIFDMDEDQSEKVEALAG